MTTYALEPSGLGSEIKGRRDYRMAPKVTILRPRESYNNVTSGRYSVGQ